MRAVIGWFVLGFTLFGQSCGTVVQSSPGTDAGDGGEPTGTRTTQPGDELSAAEASNSPTDPPLGTESTPSAMVPAVPCTTTPPKPSPSVAHPDVSTPVLPSATSSVPSTQTADAGPVTSGPPLTDAAATEPTTPGLDAGSEPDGNQQSEAAAPTYLDEFRLAVIGSSTAAGEGASDDDLGWVSLLDAALLQRAGNGFTLQNLAIGGHTSAELMPGSGANGSIDAALEGSPHLVVVALAGSNDLSNGTSTDTLFERLNLMRDAATDAGAVTFFLTTAPKDLSGDERQQLRNWADEISDDFGTCPVPGRNTEYSPCVIDVFAALANEDDGVASEYSAGDGIHLNDAGHERLFEVALPIIEPYVCANLRCD